MPNLQCPACGARSPVEAWQAESDAGRALVELLELPQPVARLMPHYIAQFRPPNGGELSWRRIAALTTALRGLVDTGTVQTGPNAPRPCPPTIWGRAIEQLLDQGSVKRPLTSHNYLLSIAYKLADAAHAEAERAREEALRRPRPAQLGKSEWGGEEDAEIEPIGKEAFQGVLKVLSGDCDPDLKKRAAAGDEAAIEQIRTGNTWPSSDEQASSETQEEA